MSGFAPFGNFWNYYQFNTVEERLQYIPIEEVIDDIFSKGNEKMSVLDVGCNEGDISNALKQRIIRKNLFSADHIYMLGIDLDCHLIERAKEKTKDIQFVCGNIMDSVSPLEFLQANNFEYFDISFVLSITMWIHLNNGDEGLNKFIEKICSLSKNIIIEPHQWDSYLKMRKRNKKKKDDLPYSLDDLKIRNDVGQHIENKLLECNFKQMKVSILLNTGVSSLSNIFP